jgi:hypothetical protein
MQKTNPYAVDTEGAVEIAQTTVHLPSVLAPVVPYTLGLFQTKQGDRFLKKSEG